MYSLRALGTPIDRAKRPTSDPLAAVGYSCIYWVDHLEESVKVEALLRMLCLYWLRLVYLFWGLVGGSPSFTKAGGLWQGGVGISTLDGNIEDHDAVGAFLRERYLYWLEALSLLRGMTEGILAIQKLEFLLQKRLRATELQELVHDGYRFIRYHRATIEQSPLQAYGSAMIFSPSRSVIKQLFKHEWPRNITIAPEMGADWNAHTGACLQTLEGHNDRVSSVVFSQDSSRVASGSSDKTIKTWDAHTGACLQTLEGHNDRVSSVVFSQDSSRVASGSGDDTIKIWDAHTVACLQTFTVGSAVYNLSFDTTGSSLHTDVGIVALRDSPTPTLTISKNVAASELQFLRASQSSQSPEYQGSGISSDGFWITRGSQNWIWLPPAYRPLCSAVGRSGIAVVIGCQSGRVLIFGFAPEDPN
ncbi:hypothetical protein N7537_011379 [Penicillium hordei]|uniref:WD40 repeat-like protein n=1 Tax=Penicillium hordei TaxID=40994 RepID=A0AAD6DLQ4_9EURO|nr:uncharacterized protein N7537_011379 [Penicillium hordei]KAJ5588701.1 hypothetical protein N7537_011379 [Penicillium hordei]